jgi:hypothetical protein
MISGSSKAIVLSLKTGCLLFALLAMASWVSGATLNPGDVFQIDFTVNPSECPSDICDALFFAPNDSSDVGAVSSALLYNGSELIGSFNGVNICCAVEFLSASSGIPLDLYAAYADFTFIQNGTIQGVFDYSVTGGSLQNFSPFVFAVGFYDGGVAFNTSSFSITSETIIAASPEPIWTSFILAVPVALMFMRRYRMQKGSMHSRNLA